jgi:glycosyltransferase involved in cell wall biosynthesis
MAHPVTVLLPLFNAARYIEAALDSLLAQTFTDFDVLIIDDGSTDESAEIAAQYAARDSRFRLIRHAENRGIVPTLNEGLDLITSPFIARMDADDIALPTRLHDQVAYLDAHPECVVVGGWVDLIDDAGRNIRVVKTPVTHDAIDRFHLQGHTSIVHPAATIRRTAIVALNGYDPKMVVAQDLDLWLRLAEHGKLHNLPFPVLQYRIHPDSISSQRAQEQMTIMHQACQSAWARRGIKDGRFTMQSHWRPPPGRASRLAFIRNTGWSAFVHGRRKTARTYALRAVVMDPFSLKGWKLFNCAFFKSSPPPDPTQSDADPALGRLGHDASPERPVTAPAPLLTVLLPVYNAARYCDRAIWSIRNQTYRSFKLLIIDDGSTDGSAAICHKHAKDDPRITFLRRPNSGLIATLNEGLALIETEFVGRMDADDIAFPERFRRQIDFLVAHPTCVCIGGWAELIDGDDRRIRVQESPIENKAIDRLHLEGHTSIVHPTAIMRTAAVRSAGNYDPSMLHAEDLDLWLRMAEYGELHNLPYPVLQYRVHAGSVSSSHAATQLQMMHRACEAAWQRRGITDGKFTLREHWRPAPDRLSQYRYYVNIGWSAFFSRHRQTAIAYGWKATCLRPLGLGGWKLILNAMAKPLPESPKKSTTPLA